MSKLFTIAALTVSLLAGLLCVTGTQPIVFANEQPMLDRTSEVTDLDGMIPSNTINEDQLKMDTAIAQTDEAITTGAASQTLLLNEAIRHAKDAYQHGNKGHADVAANHVHQAVHHLSEVQ